MHFHSGRELTYCQIDLILSRHSSRLYHVESGTKILTSSLLRCGLLTELPECSARSCDLHWLGCQFLPAQGNLHSASSPRLTVLCLTSLCVSRTSNHSKTQGHPSADLWNSFLSSRLPANSSYVRSPKLLPLFPVPSEDTVHYLGPTTVSGIWKCLQEESQGQCGAPPPRFLFMDSRATLSVVRCLNIYFVQFQFHSFWWEGKSATYSLLHHSLNQKSLRFTFLKNNSFI